MLIRTLFVGTALGCSALLATAQGTHAPAIRGDTGRTPAGCRVSAAIVAISTWFSAIQTADSARLVRTMAVKNTWVFSIGRFAASEPFVRIESLPRLASYARDRVRQHERIVLDSIEFTGWQQNVLGFLPHYTRAADDLGAHPVPGIGKGAYRCNDGLFKMNLAPLPPMLPRG